MKKTILGTSILAILLVLGSCGLSTPMANTGSLTFDFRAVSKAAFLNEGEIFSVDVYYGLDRYASKNTSTNETEGVITFGDLPLGEARIVISTGLKIDFFPRLFGSQKVTIVAGENEPVTIQLQNVPFAYPAEDLQYTDVVGLEYLADTLAVATDDNLLSTTSFTDGAFTDVVQGPALPAGVDIASLSLGKSMFESTGYEDQVWVNTTWDAETSSGGILPWDLAGGLDETFVDGFGNAAHWKSGTTPSDFTVLSAGAYFTPHLDGIGDAQDDNIAVFFQRNGGIGGTLIYRDEYQADTGLRTGWSWIINDILFTEYLGDIISGEEEAIRDFIVTDTALYVVTSFASMKISASLIDTQGGDPPTVDDIFGGELVGFASLIEATNILCVGVYDGTDPLVFLGSEDGLWSGRPGSSGVQFFDAVGASRVPGTRGFSIVDVEVSTDGTYAAFVSKRGEDAEILSILDIASGDLVSLYVRQGLPGDKINKLLWLDDDTLIVAGNQGLAGLADVAALF